MISALRPAVRLFGTCFLALSAQVAVAQQNGTWTSTISDVWSNTSAWLSATPADLGGSADFNSVDIAGTTTVTVDSVRSISSATFGDTDATTAGTWTVAAGANLTLTGTPTITTNVNTSVTGALAGTGLLTKSGSATLNLSGLTAAYAGPLNVASGTAQFRGNASTNATILGPVTGSGTVSVSQSAGNNFTLANGTNESDFDQFDGTISVPVGNLRWSQGGSAPTAAQANLARATIDLGAGGNAVYRNGTNGTLTLQLGALVGSAGSFVSGGSGAGAGTIVFQVGAKGLPTTFGGVIRDGATKSGLTKVGSSSLILPGANTYTGATAVTGGTLIVNGSLALTTVAVNSGATLGGTGSAAGATTIGNATTAGTLAPGASVGVAVGTFTQAALVIQPTGILSFDLNGIDQTVGLGTNDLVTGVTTLTLDGTLNVAEIGAGSFLSATAGNSWRLINYTGALTDNTLALGTMPALASGLFFTIDTSVANQINLLVNATAVPEASALLCVGVAVTLGAGRSVLRRRTKRAAV